MRLFTSVKDQGCSSSLQEDINICIMNSTMQLLIQIASHKLSSSLLKQNQVCGGTMIDKTYNIIPSQAKASFLAWMYQFSIQSVKSSISFAAFNMARTAGLGFMN